MNDPEHTDEAEWVRQCQRGEKEAYGSLVKKYMRRAYFCALGFVGSHEDALDLSQEAFSRGFSAIQTFDPNKRFFTWYYQILRNLCLNFLRHRKLEAVTMSVVLEEEEVKLEPATEELSADAQLERAELRAMLWKALWELELEDRELIVARDLLGTSYKTLADLLDCPLGTVMSRLYHARMRLRKRMERST